MVFYGLRLLANGRFVCFEGFPNTSWCFDGLHHFQRNPQKKRWNRFEQSLDSILFIRCWSQWLDRQTASSSESLWHINFQVKIAHACEQRSRDPWRTGETSSGECPTQSIKPAGSSAYGIYAYPSKRGNLRWWARSVFSKNTGYRWCFVWSSRTKVIWWVPTTSRETSLFRDTSSRGIKNSGSKRLTHKLKFDIGKLLKAFHRPFLLSDLLCFVEKYCPARGLCVCVYPVKTNRQWQVNFQFVKCRGISSLMLLCPTIYASEREASTGHGCVPANMF